MQIATGPVKGSEETRDRGVGSGAGTEEVQVTCEEVWESLWSSWQRDAKSLDTSVNHPVARQGV